MSEMQPTNSIKGCGPKHVEPKLEQSSILNSLASLMLETQPTNSIKGCGLEHADLKMEPKVRSILCQIMILACGLNAQESK